MCRVFHFATKSDLEEVIRSVESNLDLKYVRDDFSDSPEYITYESLLDYPRLGIAEGDQYVSCTIMLVFMRGEEIVQRSVPQRHGGVKYLIDPEKNPSSIRISLGGIYEEGVLIHGETATTLFTNPDSIKIYNCFARQIRKRYRKIEEFWVGKEAEELYRKGWRLTQAKRCSVDYDLKLPD